MWRGGAMDGRSLQPVSDQELERAVEADVRQRRRLAVVACKTRRPEFQKTIVGGVRAGAGQAGESATVEQTVEIGRQVAGEGRDLGLAIEDLAMGRFAGDRRAEDRGQLVAAALH